MEREPLKTKYDIAERSKQMHAYSPSIQKLIDLATSFVPYVEKAYRRGRKVVWYEGGSWYSLINGCGVIPAGVVEVYRFDGQEGLNYSQDTLNIPNETCFYAQVVIGEFILRQNTTIKKLLCSSFSCEPMQAAFQFLKKYGFETFVVDGGFIPQDEKRFENYKEICRQECMRMIKWLTDEPIDKDKMRNEHIRFNRIQHKIRKILDLRKEHSMYLKGIPMNLIFCGNGHYFGRPEEYESMLDGIIGELSALEPGTYDDAVARLVFVGQRGSVNLIQALDEAGAALTTWYTTGHFDDDVRTDIDPIEAAVEYVVGDRFYCGTTEDKCRKIEEEILKSGEKGLVLYNLMGCSYGSIEAELERIYFRERNIASLSISDVFEQGEITGQTLTRIKAFVEMLA